MATTVAQHSVATFTSPVNGTTPIDANTVRGNDNTIRSSYNDHDADPGIHVQSSTLASRPVAGTAGRKWITEDSGVYTLWFDDGTNWHPVSSENVALTVLAGENLVKGDVVKVTGWNNGQDLPEVVKTTSAADTAFAVITATVSSGSMGYATNTGIVQDVNTAAYSVGTILYANGSGGFTSTKPTSGHYQPVAYVLRANASNGVYYVEFSTPRIVERSDNTASTVVLRDSNGDFSAGTITATAVNATTLDLTNLEVTNIKAKDGTQAIAIADTTGKLTISDGVLLSALTASQAVFTDGSKNLVSNAITGTGNVVMSASPTLTGTVSAAALTVSGNVTVDTNTLFVDATNNRVGIGTTSPTAPLSIITPTSDATVGFNLRAFTTGADGDRTVISRYTSSSDGNWANSRYDAWAHIWYTNGTEKVRLDASGNLAVDTNTLYVDAANDRVGIQTATPAYPLQVRRAGGAGSLGVSIDNAVSQRTVQYFAIGDTTTDTTAHGWYTRAGTATDVLRMSVDYLGNLAVDTNTLYVDAANNRVGVGTASPAYNLQVNGAAPVLAISDSGTSGATLFSLINGGSNGVGAIQFLNGGDMGFDTGATGAAQSTKMRLTASGNLGLGVTPSAWWSGVTALQVRGASLISSDNTATVSANAYLDSGIAWRYRNSTFATSYEQTSGTHVWKTAPSGTAGNAITFTQAMTLDASGNLLVGTAGNIYGSSGRGLIEINGSSNSFLGFKVGDASKGYIQHGGTNLNIVNETATGVILFSANGSERARITSGGDFLVGVTSNSGYGGHVFSKNIADGNSVAFINSATSNPYGPYIQFTGAAPNDATRYFLTCADTGAQRATIRSNGGLANYQSNNVDLSDARTKTAITPAASMWSKIGALEIVTYKYTDQTHDDVNVGVIAQQVETVEPVWVDADGMGETPADGVPLKTVYTKDITFAAIKALQEAMARIETLEQRVLALEA